MSCMPSLEDSSMIRVVSSAKRDFWQYVFLQILFVVLTCICRDVPSLVEVSDPLSELRARLGIVGQVDPLHEDDGHELSQLILDNFGLQSLEIISKDFKCSCYQQKCFACIRTLHSYPSMSIFAMTISEVMIWNTSLTNIA